ncbi:MAG TPA: sigma-70 family RNA polymerase sigma factor [Solirubrobacterales bacterium]|nr:sigma-70 family RNA polymerase sigma factor [Solirubrobacterales bacterium]
MYGRARSIEATAETVQQAPRRATPDDAISVGELEDARLGFFQLLSRRFGREFKERHGDDLFAQAAYEFSRKLEQGEEIQNPAAWIIHCGWNRAKTEVEARDWRPRFVPSDSLPTEPIADPSWQPEESFLSEDRMRKVRDAVDRLPAYQRELLARAYFEDESVREASRQLGWSAGKGQRAHEAARKKLRSIFDGLNSSDIGFEVGLACFLSLSAAGRAAAAGVPAGLEAALQRAGHGVAEGWHKAIAFARHPLGGRRPTELTGITSQPPGRISRLSGRIVNSPVAEAAATGSDGPGRFVEVCKVVAVCALSGTGVVTAGIVGGGHDNRSSAATPARPAPRHTERHRPIEEAPTEVLPSPKSAEVEIGATDRGTPENPEPERGQVAQSVSGSKTAQEPVAKEEPTAAEEHAAAREGFRTFGGRPEPASAEAEPAAGEAAPLDEEEEASSTAPEASEASPTPKQSVEKQGEAEQFRRGFR